MAFVNRKAKFYFLSFLRHDLKASITVFFVALPLCLGISLASGAPLYSGLVAGIIGGLLVSVIGSSELSVSGPAAGLTAICATAIAEMGSMEMFFLSVAAAGVIQLLLGVFRLGGFTHFIPSAVIKGMLAAIGIILISKQVPLLVGYSLPAFWTNDFFNILTFHNAYSHLESIYYHTSRGVIIIALLAMGLLVVWKKSVAKKITFLPASFIVVIFGVLLAMMFRRYFPSTVLDDSQFVNIPGDIFSGLKAPSVPTASALPLILKNAILICFVASLETLLSVEAIDKLTPYSKSTSQNRELAAQGVANFFSGLLGGLPITAVIVRSSANVEAGAKTRLSGFFHGIWLVLLILLIPAVINKIPYCVLAIILVRTGYNLAKPKMIRSVYKLGREQFIPFMVTVFAILLTDLLIGVLIGFLYASYFIIKNTYRAGFTVGKTPEGHHTRYTIELANNVSFINKKKLSEELNAIPPYSSVEVVGDHSVYIDYDVLEIINEYKLKARHKHISLHLRNVPEVETIQVH